MFTSPATTLFLLSSLIPKPLAIPHTPPTLPRTPPPTLPTINASITSPTGFDLTPIFPIMLYTSPLSNLSPPPPSNLTTRRQRDLVNPSRPINTCAGLTHRGAHFISSWCTANSPGGTMQTYSYQCTLVDGTAGGRASGGGRGRGRSSSVTQNHRRNGRCTDEEICVDAKGGGKRKGGRMAYCVGKWSFVRYILKGENENGHGQVDMTTLEGKEAVAMFSEMDGVTPLELDSLDIEAGQSNSATSEGDADGQSNPRVHCHDCSEISTPILASQTDYLKTEARLLSSAATLGIMWLAITL